LRTLWIVATALACFTAIALSVAAPKAKQSESMPAYSHGTTGCLQGNDGPGVRLRLRQSSRCEGNVLYPYLEIDVRQLPISVHKKITIGPDNWAFSCPGPKQSCEQSSSGEIMFNHLDEASGRDIQTDGLYELRFSNGRSEKGRFKVDCTAPCG